MHRMAERGILPLIENHLRWFVDRAPIRRHSPVDSAMWMSSLDLRTGQPVWTTDRPPGVSKRCYRLIESPGGSNAYWDAPLMAACGAMSAATGDSVFAESADAYARDFLARCVAPSGLFLWGNHYYIDARLGTVVKFYGHEEHAFPIDPATENGDYHETRPLSVPWDLFWRIDAARTEATLRAQASMHVLDPATGEFNRHADRKSEHAFLEAGGILAEGLCWLGRQVRDHSLRDVATCVASFSFNHRDLQTGLLSNSPMLDRWDMHQCTSEIGMWAGCMFRCHERSGERPFATMAAEALRAWLDHAWDPESRRYFGKLRLIDGKPLLGDKITEYQPGDYCDIWEPLFPAHDYPLQTAEACLAAWKFTDDRAFREAVFRWIAIIEQSLPARDGRGGYAEHYGRVIWFLLSAAEVLEEKRPRELARRVASEAVAMLQHGDRFRTHPGEDRCDAVDGMGFLIFALLKLIGLSPDTAGMGW